MLLKVKNHNKKNRQNLVLKHGLKLSLQYYLPEKKILCNIVNRQYVFRFRLESSMGTKKCEKNGRH